MTENLTCAICDSLVLEANADRNSVVLRGMLIAKRKGEGIRIRCWDCGAETSYSVELRFYGTYIGVGRPVPKGECCIYYSGLVNIKAPSDTSIDINGPRLDTIGPGEEVSELNYEGAHYDLKSGDLRILRHNSRPTQK